MSAGIEHAPPRADVLGVPVSVCDYDQVISWIAGAVRERRRGYVCVAATHTLVSCQDDQQLADAVSGASLCVPDGQPVVWALRALGHRQMTDRVYGPELMTRALDSMPGVSVYLYGGRDAAALKQLQARLHGRHDVRIAGAFSPPHRPLTGGERRQVIDDINASGADVVWVGIGAPKQEKWMADVRAQLHAPVLVGVGAAFDFHAGLIRQAPGWMQARGLEWAFRLACEPRRLWRRYATCNPRFAAGLAVQLLRRTRAA